MYKISSEKEILDENTRKNIIKFINEDKETQYRVLEAKRRHDVYMDQTNKYVIDRFIKESKDPVTGVSEVVEEIVNRTSNISLAKVIVDKKARVFGDGTKFEVQKRKDQKIIDELTKELEIVSTFKKANKYTELQKNCALQVYPYKHDSGLYDIKTRVLQPFSYHVAVDVQDEEIALCYILPSNCVNGKYAEYIFWTKNYHMTTDEAGKVIASKSPEGMINEIGVLPIIQFSMDNTNEFWSQGGQDIIDGSILFNMLLTDTYYITKYQGMGIFYLFGEGIPKNVKIGPSSGVMLEQKPGSPTPSIGFASSNPPIDSHMRLAEQCAMLILTTNEIDASSIAGSLTSGAASGFQEAIRKAEFIGDIDEKRELYRDSVRETFEVLFKMIDVYGERGLLGNEYDAAKGKKLFDIIPTIKFPKTQIYSSEKEKLDVIQQRLDLGLDDEISAMIRDNSDLSEDDAIEVLKKRKMRELEKDLIDSVNSSTGNTSGNINGNKEAIEEE